MAERHNKHILFVSFILSLVVTQAGSLVAKVRCDDEAVIYIDGNKVGTTINWEDVWTGDIHDTARLIAVDCTNFNGPGGITASMSNGFTSDETWKCSGTSMPGWYDMGFNDSDWANAYVISPFLVSQTTSWNQTAKFNQVNWIWKDAQYELAPTHSYCRGKVECGCEYKCAVTENDFKCFCPAGYALSGDKRRCRDIDECSEKNENLPLHDCDQRCINTPRSYECQCLDGYAPVDDTKSKCIDIDECATEPDICLASFQCLNTVGSYRCVCPSGYHEVDNTGTAECVDDDECNPQTNGIPQNQCEHTCNNTPGGYTCQCKPGFSLDTDGHHCSDVDECSRGTHDCLTTFECLNTIGSHECVCPSGYSERGFPSCFDDNECERQNGGCEQICSNTIGSFVCLCDKGHLLQDDGKTCTQIESSCPEKLPGGLIASIVVNIILVILLIVIGIFIFRRRDVIKRGSTGQNSDFQIRNLELAHSYNQEVATEQSPAATAEIKSEHLGKPEVSKTEDALSTVYEQVVNLGADPYQSLDQTVQYANADVSPYEDLHHQKTV